jgi:hypothetical protein
MLEFQFGIDRIFLWETSKTPFPVAIYVIEK